MPARLQEFIHRLEVGTGSRLINYLLGIAVMAGLAVYYDATRFRNLDTMAGMDAAQLARNLAAGEGFTTRFVRPLSMHLVEQHRADHQPRLNGGHPDLANAPLYPVLLAAALALMPFDYPDLTTQTVFEVYLPDLWIAIVNQVLFLLAVGWLFLLARRWFDETVAWLSAVALLGAEGFWRLSLSGTSALLLVVIGLALADVLSRLESATRDPHAPARRLGWLAAGAGALVAAGCLGRYAFGWLILPVGLWMALVGGQHRIRLCGTAAAVFFLVITPWLVRNWAVSGSLFGTAGYAIYQDTAQFTGDQLERTLAPSFLGWSTADWVRKALANARAMVAGELPSLGGSWVIGLFWVGLLVPFRSPTRSRIRYWLLFCFVTLFVVQAFGGGVRTADSAAGDAESLLILLAPLIFVYGVSLFVTLAGQLPVADGGRRLLWSAFVVFACAPLGFRFLSPRSSAVAYPPYYPPWIMAKSRHVPPNGLVVTDMPWAMAWYGHRQSVWLPLKHRGDPNDKVRDDFYAVHSRKPVAALYLTGITLKTIDTSALEQWAASKGEPRDWTGFAVGTFLRGEVPTGFPLRFAPEGLGAELFLTDSEH
ncbi:MAG: hypothetical protein JXQ71_09825 [Verrucomicrobia bacterium]|nr:hypothetical protein [Verrucomicrobiota bacterium]